ncbi:MAG: 3-deoxy-D-manno-octulosonic acid kinase [Gammaproteobacteria bacterium]|nr:3-deoxy-D-manno-octulosonic acid kinase [Gammaproteobacteria bacterium]MCW8924373.1 3-deoxy-D-manno-octulosonic acid kinase [Gammaproteobacteria bacterium]
MTVSSENIKIKSSGQRHILYDAALIEHPDETLFFPEVKSADKPVMAIGRAEARFFNYQEHDLVLKQYLRGGMIAPLLGDRYFGLNRENTRSFKEFRLLHQLQTLELPAPVPVAASAERSGLFFRAALVTKEIPNAQTLADQLMLAVLEDSQWQDVGRCIRQFHNYDVYHADLNARNILLSENKVYLIDFDKGAFRYLGDSWKASNLARLKRSLLKFKSLNQEFYFDEDNWKQLLQGYSDD